MSAPETEIWRERLMAAQTLVQIDTILQMLQEAHLPDEVHRAVRGMADKRALALLNRTSESFASLPKDRGGGDVRAPAPLGSTRGGDPADSSPADASPKMIPPAAAASSSQGGKGGEGTYHNSPVSRATDVGGSGIGSPTSPAASPVAPAILAKPSLTVVDASKLYDVPANMILLFRGEDGIERPYVTKDGVLYLLKKHGFRASQAESAPDLETKGGWVAKASIYPMPTPEDRALLLRLIDMGDKETFRAIWADINRPTTATATANIGNIRGGERSPSSRRLREMAETRALLRAARMFVGTGEPEEAVE